MVEALQPRIRYRAPWDPFFFGGGERDEEVFFSPGCVLLMDTHR